MVHSLFKTIKYSKSDVVISYADILYDPFILQTLAKEKLPVFL